LLKLGVWRALYRKTIIILSRGCWGLSSGVVSGGLVYEMALLRLVDVINGKGLSCIFKFTGGETEMMTYRYGAP
jgi:hypothetical protein